MIPGTLAVSRMKRGALILVLAMACQVTRAADTVVLGQGISTLIEEVEIPCPAEAVCLGGWFKWEIAIERVVSGPAIAGRVVAARIQTSQMIPSVDKSMRLFVLKPIEDPNQRALLRADYYLEDVSAVHSM